MADDARPRRARRRPAVRRERNAEETKRRILAAAEDELARKGYDGARLRDVALAAGVNHALVHHYFRDKEGLFRAVVERAFGALSSQAFEVLARTESVKELLEGTVDLLVDFYADNPNLVQILHFASIDEGSPAYATCEEVAMRIVLPMLEATTRIVREAQARGELRSDVEPRRLIALAMGAVAHLFHEDRFFTTYLGEDVRSARALREHKRATVAFLMDALLVRRP